MHGSKISVIGTTICFNCLLPKSTRTRKKKKFSSLPATSLPQSPQLSFQKPDTASTSHNHTQQRQSQIGHSKQELQMSFHTHFFPLNPGLDPHFLSALSLPGLSPLPSSPQSNPHALPRRHPLRQECQEEE